MTASGRPRVVGVCGSLRADSYTRVALEHVLEEAANAGATTDVVDLRHLSLPVFDPAARDAADAPALRRRVRAADAIVLGTPTYHGSYASPLKTALDYCGFDEFEGTLVGLLAVSGGRSAHGGPLTDLRGVVRALRAWTLPHEVGIGTPERVFAEDGAFREADSALADRVSALGRALVDHAAPDRGEAGVRLAGIRTDD